MDDCGGVFCAAVRPRVALRTSRPVFRNNMRSMHYIEEVDAWLAREAPFEPCAESRLVELRMRWVYLYM
jgi:hypothetical protein